jgi:hypothetical protein
MKDCLNEGVLQSYFDGELSSELRKNVTAHLAACGDCRAAAAELESENGLLASALEAEFAANVPTERLRQRINVAISGSPGISPIFSKPVERTRGWFQSLVDLFTFTPQRTFGYAGLVVVLTFAAIFAVVRLRQTTSPQPQQIAEAPTGYGPTVVEVAAPIADVIKPIPEKPVSLPGPAPIKYRDNQKRRPALPQAGAPQVAVKLLPGERSYLKTIAALDSTIRSSSNRPMRPSLQAEYERNLALVDSALAAARSAAKSNPNDPDAAEFMFSAYQSKVDLLNTVADARLNNRQP